jgi:pyruvate dehydrogenase E1 component alpha subunit
MVWKLPVLWVCENNMYGMGTSVERASAVSDIRQKAEGYGMKNRKVDGMDLLKVREVAAELFDEIRAGSGPQFLEVNTYRFRGHSMGDPERYRSTDEVHSWQENDPIGIYHKALIKMKVASEAELNHQTDLAEQEVVEAVAFAESSPEPTADIVFNNVYVEN